jgi:ABC-type proline/glycine betaine transport system substrate-binding protein
MHQWKEMGMVAPIVLGRIDESFRQVAAAVAEETLRRLGHTVEVREGPHPQMYPLLGAGELHVFASSWLPGAWLTANRVAFERLPEHTREALGRITLADASAMDRNVNLDGRSPLVAAQAWMGRHRDDVATWLS